MGEHPVQGCSLHALRRDSREFPSLPQGRPSIIQNGWQAQHAYMGYTGSKMNITIKAEARVQEFVESYAMHHEEHINDWRDRAANTIGWTHMARCPNIRDRA